MKTFIEISVGSSDDFLKIRETLTRMGIANRNKKILFQSCHILHKQGKYYIVHFKELFGLDGRPVEFLEEDFERRNAIALTLEKWDLCKIIGNKPAVDEFCKNLSIISHKEKHEWTLQPKYKIGKKIEK